ncbi:MAG: hypothetical protein Q4D84_00260 [Campylobacter sp.]|nr:hypothetical protein [Campylobacter sp.]
MNLKEFLKGASIKPYGIFETSLAVFLSIVISAAITLALILVSMSVMAIIYSVILDLNLSSQNMKVFYVMGKEFMTNYLVIAICFIFFCFRSLKRYVTDNAEFISYGISFGVAVVCALVSIVFNGLVLIHSFTLDSLSWFLYYFSSIIIICLMAYSLRDIVDGNYVKRRLFIAGFLLMVMVGWSWFLLNLLEIRI